MCGSASSEIAGKDFDIGCGFHGGYISFGNVLYDIPRNCSINDPKKKKEKELLKRELMAYDKDILIDAILGWPENAEED